MIDVHTHMSSHDFDDDRPQVLQRAREQGVDLVFSAGEDYEDNLKVLDLARKYGSIRPCLGHFPSNLDMEMAEKTARLIRENLDTLVAIGEVGLDYWKVQDERERKTMEEIFSLFIDLSAECSLPLVVHSRSSGKYAIEMLSSQKAGPVCLHAFDGKAGAAVKGVEGGYYFSIPPSILRSAQKQKLVASLPLSHLLLETDSPVLGPDAEQRNEPVNLILAAEKIAEIKRVSLQEVMAVTGENTRRLFSRLADQCSGPGKGAPVDEE